MHSRHRMGRFGHCRHVQEGLFGMVSLSVTLAIMCINTELANEKFDELVISRATGHEGPGPRLRFLLRGVESPRLV